LEEDWGKGKGGFLIQHNVYGKKRKEEKRKKGLGFSGFGFVEKKSSSISRFVFGCSVSGRLKF
jgi:hypothetical protein